jgi:hypothetical protein
MICEIQYYVKVRNTIILINFIYRRRSCMICHAVLLENQSIIVLNNFEWKNSENVF